MIRWIKKNFYWIILIILCLGMFGAPAFSNKPFGLDALGHFSKISYIKAFQFADWDMSWYSGTLFLKLYPPFYYYFLSSFKNVFLASNLFCFFSVLLSSLGIYFFVEYLTKKKDIALFGGLGFLTVLSISYYWISTANLPYFCALWAIPFSLYFLERALREEDWRFFLAFSGVVFLSIITHVVIGFIVGFLALLRFVSENKFLKNTKKIIFYLGVPVLLSSFWFFPFLFLSKSSGGYKGYVPKIFQLFGLTDNISWGFNAGGIGVFAFISLFVLVLSIFYLRKIKTHTKFLFVSSFLLGFLLMGGLGSYYPYGVDAVRFILPFSIILISLTSVLIGDMKINKRFFLILFLFFVLVAGLIWNFYIIQKNIERFSYHGEDSRYGIFTGFYDQGLPFENEFSNYRFGTSKYVFGETINYFMPKVQQTFGYQDAGMLNSPRYYDMRWNIWMSDNLNDAIYWLDWFGIKYFEAEASEFNKKFDESLLFKKVTNGSEYYNFTMYEYLDAKPIISLVDYLDGNKSGPIKEFSFERNHPDSFKIFYENADEGDIVLFKEFYHKNWVAKDLTSGNKLGVIEVGPGFMGAYVPESSEGMLFEYRKGFLEIFSIILSILILIYLIISSFFKNFRPKFLR
ncbi:MAG: hypothetical protein KC516_00680 [Nanoarchaeota archaeon]|nr:hypothetical protein [Nanoarchaeota archaeon]